MVSSRLKLNACTLTLSAKTVEALDAVGRAVRYVDRCASTKYAAVVEELQEALVIERQAQHDAVAEVLALKAQIAELDAALETARREATATDLAWHNATVAGETAARGFRAYIRTLREALARTAAGRRDAEQTKLSYIDSAAADRVVTAQRERDEARKEAARLLAEMTRLREACRAAYDLAGYNLGFTEVNAL